MASAMTCCGVSLSLRAHAAASSTVQRRVRHAGPPHAPAWKPASSTRSAATPCPVVAATQSHQFAGTRLQPSVRRCVLRTRSSTGSVRASFLGVGAPEAFVIAVVSLLVFGPKGLAEIAKNLGQTLRAFQPTIKELQQVSQEFKSALETEIGLDESKAAAPRPPRSDLDATLTDEMRRSSEAAAWGRATDATAAEVTEIPAQPGKLPDLSQLKE